MLMQLLFMFLFLVVEVDNSRTMTVASHHGSVSKWRTGCARVDGEGVANQIYPSIWLQDASTFACPRQ